MTTTDQEMQELFDTYKRFKDFIKADRSLKKQGVWSLISSEDLPYMLKYVRLFEEKILNNKK